MNYTKLLLLCGLFLFMGAAQAELSSSLLLTSDYDFRGVSKTATDPALQIGLKHIDERQGWYLGGTVSNVDFGHAQVELALSSGFAAETDVGLGWDAGMVYYAYDQNENNFPEIYTAFSYDYLKAKLSYSGDFAGQAVAGHTKAFNLSVDTEIPTPLKSVYMTAHLGRSEFSQTQQDYTDFAVGAIYRLQYFNVSVKYVDTTLPDQHADVLSAQGRLVVFMGTSISW